MGFPYIVQIFLEWDINLVGKILGLSLLSILVQIFLEWVSTAFPNLLIEMESSLVNAHNDIICKIAFERLSIGPIGVNGIQ